MPTIPELLQKGIQLHRGNQFAEARRIYQQVLELDPNQADALNLLGLLSWKTGQFAQAVDHLRKAIEIDRSQAPYFANLGEAYRGLRRYDEAIENYRKAIRLQPSAAVLRVQLGSALREWGRPSEALEHFQRAAALRPDMASDHSNLAVVLQDLGRLDEARASIERALEIEPGRAEFLYNMGIILKDLAKVDEAIVWHDRAIAAQSGFGQALCSRGTALLSLGRFAEGWAGYEHRVGCPLYDTLQFPQPLWDGSPLAGRRLLIHCEQGFGDTLQFIRYLPLVRERGNNVIIAVQASLVPLLAHSGYSPLVAKVEPLPPFDVHAPLMSLPRIFGTGVDSVPADVPYLSIDPVRQQRWCAELEKHAGFKVGIAWQGRKNFCRDFWRSIPLHHFAPLAQVAGVRLTSLQIGAGGEQLSDVAERFDVVDLGAMLEEAGAEFSDTAAAMKCLDLVITSDTAVAHLAGALGVPVWVALSFAPDWRWMYGRDDSPWYPTMRLFRQTELGQWPDVFDRMAETLREQL